MLFAGHDTSATSLTRIFHFLHLHPEAADRLRQEQVPAGTPCLPCPGLPWPAVPLAIESFRAHTPLAHLHAPPREHAALLSDSWPAGTCTQPCVRAAIGC